MVLIRVLRLLFLLCCLVWPVSVPAAHAQTADSTRVDEARLDRIDAVVREAIDRGDLPGAVVLVSHRGRVVYHRAFGLRAVVPRPEPMTLDTVFDLASLTKVVATTTAVMMLVEEGRVRLRDPVASWLPGFERHGKDDIRVEHLLTHLSGLRPDLPLEEEFEGADVAMARIFDERPVSPPGVRFVYSDLNFILLGEIVSRVSGTTLDEFAARRIFTPLGMTETGFRPSPDRHSVIAPTEACRPLGWPCGDPGVPMLRGVVHDPTARRMGGVAGHAGLFGSASDLARFSEMMLASGLVDGRPLLSEMTVRRMTTVSTPPAVGERRGLGWDIDSRYSSNRGDLFGASSYGHTGFTGTSLWLDPETRTAVIFLSSRVHPDGAGNVTALRGRVATLAAAALTGVVDRPATPAEPVVTGLERLRRERFARLRHARVGLLTNHTGRDEEGRSAVELLHAAETVDLRRVFSPEHGITGDADASVADARDPATGVVVHSLYGPRRRPTAEMLDDLDVIVVDLQDAGTRFYTYATTMAYVMEEAAGRGVRVVVLDRPNPIAGSVEGPLLDPSAVGFTGYLPMPTRHGLTLGELARVFDAERGLGVDLDVVPMVGWVRSAWYDETGLVWVDPSPNLRTIGQAALYPGIGGWEQTNISVGRGTDTPFELVGAPWIDGVALARHLNDRRLPGVRFHPVEFTPTSSRFAGEQLEGIRILITQRRLLRPVRMGVEIGSALHRRHPEAFDIDAAARLLGSRAVIERIKRGDDPAAIARSWRGGERDWRDRVARYLLYRP